VADDAEAGGHKLTLVGHIFTKLLQVFDAAWAIRRRRQIRYVITWQMLEQRVARRATGRRHFRFGLDVIGLQVFQLQFKLFDLVVELLGPRPNCRRCSFAIHNFKCFISAARVFSRELCSGQVISDTTIGSFSAIVRS
jgi:hypothetical protein